jgi:hypothetical protein
MKMIDTKEKKMNLSSSFTIEDIHKIREWDYERFKNSPRKDLIEHINKVAEKFRKESGRKYEIIGDGMFFYPKQKNDGV